ncbi:LysR substrate-binding domain-containing protein [Rubellimicrobium aerolatum]|uniref:LysR substrate-binding domain-containing protein n=1 Tax=Rubellimicrobium aerolatum TaxID=490979 RepID=A0ABW0S8K6_9RHOB|nr:LysR substrate-binding domain-containing protein [Rubellimicrobium aerolatum]MBP1804193.1 LysR family pca operon transcriptional activator [Rubellimicrobium aerolatum]
MHPAIKLRHVRAFLAIAAEGSLSAVARAEGITQPALSRTLAELEDLLGQSLFLRQGRSLRLTEAGAVFRRHAAEGVAALEAGAAALRGGKAEGQLSVGVLPTVATRFFPCVALRFREMRPDTTLSIATGPQGHLVGLLRDGRIDLLAGRMPEPREMAGLAFEHLYEEQVELVARAGHPLAHLPPADLLARVPLVLPPEGAAIRRTVDDYLASLGLAGIRAAVETVSHPVGRGVLLGSDAVWFISRGVVVEELETGRLQAIPTDARRLAGAVGLTLRQGEAGAALALLVEIAREAARAA